MNIVASIQARMGSERLPGKVLADICGKPMLQWQIERLKKSNLINDIVVATTNSKKDEPIIEFCLKNNLKFFRGSESDVLKRVSNLIKEFKVDIHIECCGDSPLIDPQIVDQFLEIYLQNIHKVDYLTNSLSTTYPPGMEVTIYKGETLNIVDELIDMDDQFREHVGYNITRFNEKFNLRNIEAPPNFNYPEIYLEVDNKEDLILMRNIFGYFKSINKNHFNLAEILQMLKAKPELSKINCNVHRRWKVLREENV